MSTPCKSDVGNDPELQELQTNFNEQQAKITALREIIRQTEVVNDMKNATAQEKVKNIAQRLTHFKTKVTTSRLNRANSANTATHPSSDETYVKLPADCTDVNPSFQRGRSESSSIEKCSLLRQQIEKNRKKMAERESCKREIEEKVIEIKHKLETTQQCLEKSSELDRTLSYVDEMDTITSDDTVQVLPDQFNRPEASINSSICFLDNTSCRWQESELSLLKDSSQHSLIGFSSAITTRTKNDALLEGEIKALKENLQEKNNIIDGQLQMISKLVNNLTGFESTASDDKHNDIFLVMELRGIQLELLKRSHKLSMGEAEKHLLDSYGYDPLEKITETSQNIWNERAHQNKHDQSSGEVTDEVENINQRIAIAKIASLEATIVRQELEMENLNHQKTDLLHSLEEKTIELNVMAANVSVLQEKLKSSGPKPLFPRLADEELGTETSKLKQQLDESNKTMIKCKLRIKQLQKQVDSFKKMSNVHEEVARLTEELHVVSIAKEERRKDNQPTQDGTTGDLIMILPEMQKRIVMLELTCQNQASAMQLLEEQKNDLNEDLCRTRNELQSLNEQAVGTESSENGRIASQMLSIELEEQLETCLAEKTELMKVFHTWEAEKAELQQKLKQCMEENAELMSKIEKLSIEKVSSAESIEILENLTLHEKQEMERSEKRAFGQEDKADGHAGLRDSKENLNDSLFKLMEESKELMDKVEMFTDERREVLEKLDAISIENQAYICELDKLKEINEQLRSYSAELASSKIDLEEKLRAINDEKNSILHELDSVRINKNADDTKAPTASFQTSVDVKRQEESFASEAYEQALVALENEVSNYNKNKDKQKKQQISKKLAAHAKNLVTMSKQLLNDYSSCLLQRAMLKDQIATLAQKTQSLQQTNATSAETREVVGGVITESMCRQEGPNLGENPELEVASDKSSDDEPELLKVELNSKNEEIVALKRIVEAQAKSKSMELLHLQQELLDAQAEVRLRAQQTVELRSKCDILHAERDKYEETFKKLNEELQHSNAIVQQQLQAIATMEAQIDELSQSAEEYNLSRHNANEMKQRIQELTGLLSTRNANGDSEKAELEKKNQELLDKLKKFAANLKRKNVQCSELEQENKQLYETNQRLLEQQERIALESLTEGDAMHLREENATLVQKLHHLNNELHRLLEQKYIMEAECKTSRDEVSVLNEKLQAAEERLSLLANRLHVLEEELEGQRVELEERREELVSKSSKIEKCKAIIKEKIKETHRLQEYERRTTYLEDELRMTQSKLEDFHNQTLLLGRLKSEKEELNALVRAENEQRRNLEHLLNETKEELEAAHEKDRTVSSMLACVETWVRWFGNRWGSPGDVPLSDKTTEVVAISDLFGWCAVLTDTESIITRVLEEKTNELWLVNQRVRETEQKSRSLHVEMEHAKAELAATQNKSLEQQQTIAEITQQLENAQRELQQAMNAHSQIVHQQSKLLLLQNRLQEVDDKCSSLQNSLDAAEKTNSELSREILKLRETVTSSEQLLHQEKANVGEVTTANQALQEKIEFMRERSSLLERSHHDLQVEYKNYRQEDEIKLTQLKEEAQTMESTLNDALRRNDLELNSMREEYDTQRVQTNQELAALRKAYEDQIQKMEQLKDDIKQKDEELELLRKGFEEQREDNIQTKEFKVLREDYKESLMKKTRKSEQLTQKNDDPQSERKDNEEQLMIKAHTYDLMNDAVRRKNEELEALRNEYLEQRMELSQTWEQLRQKDNELANLRKAFEDQQMTKTQLKNILHHRDEELELPSKSLREKGTQTAQTKDQLDEQRDVKLEALRQDYEEELMEVKHSKKQLHEALERKNEELESLRKTYKDYCEQQDLLGRRHFQELDALQQKMRESVGERVMMQQSIDSMMQAANDQTTEIIHLRARIASLEKQTNENLTNTSILSSLNEALNEELDQLQDRMQSTAESSLSGAVADDGTLEGVIRHKDETIEQLGAQQTLMQQEIIDLKVKAGKLLRKLKETRARCSVLESANASFTPGDGWDVGTASSELSKKIVDDRVQELESRLNELQHEKDTLLVKLDTLEAACEKLTDLKEYQDKQIELLRDASQELDLRDRLQRANAALQTREAEVVHLSAQLEQMSCAAEKADKLRIQLRELDGTVSFPTTAANKLQLQLTELEQTNLLLQEEKREMGRELEVLNQQILRDLKFEDRLNNAMLELDAKNVELQMLRSTLEQMADQAAPITVQDQIITLETHTSDIELQQFKYEEQLESPIQATEYERVVEQPEVAAMDRSVNPEVRDMLERQELEIVTLKEQLAVRSAEFARLAAHVDPTRLLGLINSGAPSLSIPEQQQNADRDSRAELELALYMIYQRDMRCDELELELRNLLEERDALQLRLSNALRMHEEFRLKCVTTSTGADNVECGTSGECSIDSSPERPTAVVPVSADDPRPISSMSTAADSPDLSSKLSELHSISYSKEKRWQEEREDRNRQLTLIQRDLANMPLEAAAKITGTEVADTSSMQRASSVLLNWILGKK